jgi:uncharacterized membrane protein
MFSIKEAIAIGWQKTKENLWLLVGVFVFALIITSIMGELGNMAEEANNLPVEILVRVTSLLIDVVIGLGLARISLAIHDGKPVTFQDLYKPLSWPLFGHFLLATVIFYLAGFGPFVLAPLAGFFGILLIILGIYLGLRLGLYSYFIVDQNVSGNAALKASWQATKGEIWHLVGFGLASAAIMVLGALALFVGVFVALPTVVIATAHVYRQLLGAHATAAATTINGPVPTVTTP